MQHRNVWLGLKAAYTLTKQCPLYKDRPSIKKWNKKYKMTNTIQYINLNCCFESFHGFTTVNNIYSYWKHNVVKSSAKSDNRLTKILSEITANLWVVTIPLLCHWQFSDNPLTTSMTTLGYPYDNIYFNGLQQPSDKLQIHSQPLVLFWQRPDKKVAWNKKDSHIHIYNYPPTTLLTDNPFHTFDNL